MRPLAYAPALGLAVVVAAIAWLVGVVWWHAVLAAIAIVAFRVTLELVPALRPAPLAPSSGDGAASAGGLTVRQTEIAVMVAQGMTNKEIARRLFIQLPTVKNHVHNILNKLQLSRRGQAAALAHHRGLFQSDGVPVGLPKLRTRRSGSNGSNGSKDLVPNPELI